MTAWERGLPPKTERHWLLWLALAVLLVLGAWRGAEWLLAHTQQPAARLAAPPPAARLNTLMAPCPAGSRATTVWVQPDVNLADGMNLIEREASMWNNTAVAAQMQQREQRVAQNKGDEVLG